MLVAALSDYVVHALRTALLMATPEPTAPYVGSPSLTFWICLFVSLAVGLRLFTLRRISHPLAEMRRSAERFAAGDFSHRLPVPDTAELGSLAMTLNHMAAQLAAQINVVTKQRNEQEAILTSMQEGVLALDPHNRLISVNRAAEALLGVTAVQARGRTMQEVVRNVALQHLLAEAMPRLTPTTAEIVLRGEEERVLQATATPLRDAAERDIGMLVVLNDVTQIRHLENIRRDFVANVSHELKTPITSIKGFVETLRDGALDDRALAERFLGIVARHADRLHAIIEDLLSLSRLEQGTESYDIPRTEAVMTDVFAAAMLDCAATAAARQVTIAPSCPPALRAWVNAPLLEQALVNLLENAITYSNAGSTVWLTACQAGETLSIAVRDQGVGIPPEHLSRIFERFYRVDKARSREHGGTGLGLAIVKHIAQVHGGQVAVTSTVGQGSTFTVRLPLVPAEPAGLETVSAPLSPPTAATPSRP
jgi:two-component system phosphate regulon sensor histidine kinase PhoR